VSSAYADVILRHRRELDERPALRAVYARWAKKIRASLAADVYVDDGRPRSIELGCGAGALTEHLPELFPTDVMEQPFAKAVVDACALPYRDGALRNIVAIDTLHHLPSAARFFDEIARALDSGGRAILVEPYLSALGLVVYKAIHHEPARVFVNPFDPVQSVDPDAGLPCNQALATLIFGPWRRAFLARWPMLRVVTVEKCDALLYALTGGYSKKSLIGDATVRRLAGAEDAVVARLSALLALRMVVVIERL
jgi:SAM-dependent methyltransferase